MISLEMRLMNKHGRISISNLAFYLFIFQYYFHAQSRKIVFPEVLVLVQH